MEGCALPADMGRDVADGVLRGGKALGDGEGLQACEKIIAKVGTMIGRIKRSRVGVQVEDSALSAKDARSAWSMSWARLVTRVRARSSSAVPAPRP